MDNIQKYCRDDKINGSSSDVTIYQKIICFGLNEILDNLLIIKYGLKPLKTIGK